MRKTILRISASILLLLSVLFAPFYISLILGIFCIAYFHFFAEAIFLFLLSDLLYGAPEAKFSNIVFVSFIISIVLFIGIELFKKKLRLNSK